MRALHHYAPLPVVPKGLQWLLIVGARRQSSVQLRTTPVTLFAGATCVGAGVAFVTAISMEPAIRTILFLLVSERHVCFQFIEIERRCIDAKPLL